MMNIAANVSSRAEKTFSALVGDFKTKFPKAKQEAFCYEVKGIEDILEFKYKLEKTWISRIYKLEISYSIPLALNNIDVDWNHHKKKWQTDSKRETTFTAALNNNKILKELIRKVDFEKVKLSVDNQMLKVNLITVPGCFVWTLIPPMHYFVRLKQEEYLAIESILQLIKETCLKVERDMRKLQVVK